MAPPDSPDAGATSVAASTSSVAVAVWPAPAVTTRGYEPAARLGTVKVLPENVPLTSVVAAGVSVTAEPLNLAVTGELAANPCPVTLTAWPTAAAPVADPPDPNRVSPGANVNEGAVAVFVPSLALTT